MPLVRVEVRNEYGLGMPELYTETDREDPKAVLDGVAVAGLVGVLRQLGDLAEFAAEVFHGLQEQVLITSSRSHKLVERVHNIEAALPPLERAILAQRSHLHFAYTAGSHWHTRLRTEQNHFIYSDLPRFVMDSYEDCRDPPRLHKLDKFDIGGPGSCFKRYSDPTYFKRASAGPYQAHLQGLPREKKSRRSKKKRYSLKHKDATRGAPKFTHDGRTDFGSSYFKEKTSPSQEVSTYVAPKSGIEPETEDHLTSFDSRTGSGYIECIFRPSYSTQSEDNNAKEPSSDSNLQHNSYLDSASIDENGQIADENTQNSYFPDHNESRSSYITWDEKLEIIDSSRPNDAMNDATEVSCTTVKKDLNARVVDHIDFDVHDEPLPSIPVGGQPDEIESETDYYMDALNTIESESETDIDCQTKRELLQNKEAEGKHRDGDLDGFEFRVEENTSSSKPMPPELETYSSSNNENVEAGGSTVSYTSPEKLKSKEIERHEMNSETVSGDGIVSRFREPNSPTLPSEQIDSVVDTAHSQPVMFWTNGGLLGLEPSKPPDFGLPTVVRPEPVEEAKNDATHLSPKQTLEDTVVNGSKSESSNGSVPKDDSNSSSRIFEFSNRLLVNGFRKQISLVGDERLASSVRSDVPEKTSVRKDLKSLSITGKPFGEQFGNESPFKPPSSPPLEHMRISFQPIDGFEASKLKLAFPDGGNNMFPSFQLVPEPAISLHDSGSDSDDDTFCRSSPYASDDCRSHPSESNSDQWDSGDSPGINNHELDDAFGRLSSSESVSSSLVSGIRFPDPGNYGHQSSFTDIPNFESMNALLNSVIGDSDGKYVDPTDPTPIPIPTPPPPPPPPLPPMEWRGIKPHPCVTNENEDTLSEALNYTLNLTPPKPTVLQQPKPAPLKPDHFIETVDHTLKYKQSDNVSNESNRKVRKMIEEKEDFLQQIRTKSLNLRRTSINRSTNEPAGTTNVKVTAILEKANAIREAVGSDDGEDDNWSDT